MLRLNGTLHELDINIINKLTNMADDDLVDIKSFGCQCLVHFFKGNSLLQACKQLVGFVFQKTSLKLSSFISSEMINSKYILLTFTRL